ncbi:DNA sulfur modification protein DndB [Paenibacillus sp. JCM 10914]|uniref:DNA sulfur modification protein DndB n=1 Tax=Paenibacillus sp. JCM 10914 TaxID=1236974 RepID=UPI0003CCB3B6|nr:DNA sulfur modification protein DndB [Paenibacillus sp. JCM 10914]GAE05285.1 hypothetical protein JCM10914_1381 [Paenibacillus sp. JCM 10914]
MFRDREELEKSLLIVLEEIKHDRKILELVNRELKKYSVTNGTINSIARGHERIASIETAKLCLICLAVHTITGIHSISPYEYFSEREVEESKKVSGRLQTNQVLKLPIQLEDVIMLELDHYITKVKMSDLVQMYHSQLITYDYETQRSPKFKSTKSGVLPVPDINKKSVEDISQHMLSETYLSDMLTLNVYSTEVEPILFNRQNKTLTINKGAIISILDGFHRLQGGVRAVAINPDLDLDMILSVRSYDTDTAKKYFGQINTINVVKPQRLKELKSQSYSDIVVKDLQKNSDLKGRIASSSKISEIAGQLTTFDILSYAIDKVFEPKTTLEAKELSKYLVDFFNYLSGLFAQEFILNPNEYRESYINHPLMFAAYIQIAKQFKEQGIDLNKIKDRVEEIEFHDHGLIEILQDRRGMNNNRNRNAIMHYFS